MINLFNIFKGKSIRVRYDEFSISKEAYDYLVSEGYTVPYKDLSILVLKDQGLCIFSDKNGILKRVSYDVTKDGIYFEKAN